MPSSSRAPTTDETTNLDNNRIEEELKYIEYKSVDNLWQENPHLNDRENAKLLMDILPKNLAKAAYSPTKYKYGNQNKTKDRPLKLSSSANKFRNGRMVNILHGKDKNLALAHAYEKQHHHHFIGHDHGHRAALSTETMHFKHDFAHTLFVDHTQYDEHYVKSDFHMQHLTSVSDKPTQYQNKK